MSSFVSTRHAPKTYFSKGCTISKFPEIHPKLPRLLQITWLIYQTIKNMHPILVGRWAPLQLPALSTDDSSLGTEDLTAPSLARLSATWRSRRSGHAGRGEATQESADLTTLLTARPDSSTRALSLPVRPSEACWHKVPGAPLGRIRKTSCQQMPCSDAHTPRVARSTEGLEIWGGASLQYPWCWLRYIEGCLSHPQDHPTAPQDHILPRE